MRRAGKKQTVMPVLGLDTSKPAEWISDQNSPNCQNVDEFDGQIRKRFGFPVQGAVVAGTNLQILNGLEFKSAGVNYVARIGADKAESLNTSTGVWASISGATTLNTDENDEVAVATPFLSGDRMLVFTSSAYVPQKWTGSGDHADLGGTPPKAKYCEAFGGYLVLAHITDDGGNAYRTRIQWSDTADPENWSTGNSGSKDLVEGEDITGIKTYGNYLSVHKRDRLYLGYLVSTAAVIKFDEKYTPGTIAHNTIQNLPNGSQCYLAVDGIRLFNGSSSVLIDSPINTELRNSLNLAYAYRSWSIVVEDLEEYWVGVPVAGAENANVIYRFNYNTGQIYKNTFFQDVRSAWIYSNIAELTWDDLVGTWDAQQFSWDDSANSIGIELPMLGTIDGYTYKYDKTTTDDNDQAVSSFFESKDYHVPEQLGKMIRWNRMELWAKGTDIKVLYSIDGGETWNEIGSYTLNSSYPLDDSPIMLYFDTVSTKIRFKFLNETSEGSFHFKQFVIYGTPRESRGI